MPVNKKTHMKSNERKSKEGSEGQLDNAELSSCSISASSKEHMSEDEIKKRLADRAMTYLMFLDD